jgi:[NiFe] hydrogenase assembly HybE family chaperone
MKEFKDLQNKVEAAFDHILQQHMLGMPILNPMIRVETLGFQLYEERIMGVVITPWLMNLILFPNENDNWQDMKIGKKQDHLFPSNRHEFMLNEIEGIGICQTLSLYSPMHDFENQDHAIAAATAFLEILLKPVDEDERLDEKRLEQFLDGQEMDGIYQKECLVKAEKEQQQKLDLSEQRLSRRDILRGNFVS